jgi:hypothetical protein
MNGFFSGCTACLWLLNIAYCLSLLPQIILNYRLKTTKGLSDLYILGYFCGYFLNIFYVYTLPFPLPYHALAPITFAVVSFMLFQRFLYKDAYNKIYYAAAFFLLIFYMLIFIINPLVAGHLAGWLLVLIWSLYQLPQAIAIYSKKSVVGFSFLLVTLIGMGNIVEFTMCILLKLPVQQFLIALRGIIFYTIFCLQFWLYGKK